VCKKTVKNLPPGCKSYSLVLAGSTVTNVGLTQVHSSVSTSPGTEVKGFGPGKLVGDIKATLADGGGGGDAELGINAHNVPLAKAGLEIMYTEAMTLGKSGDIPPALGAGATAAFAAELTIKPGVHFAAAALTITGHLVLDGDTDPTAKFVFQVGSALTIVDEAKVILINGALASNVYWVVGSSATIGKNAEMVGIIMAYASINMMDGASLNGAALAKVAAVTLIRNHIWLDGSPSASLSTCTSCVSGLDLKHGQCGTECSPFTATNGCL
jgi:hypothetical protein